VNRIMRAAEALGVRPPKNVREKLVKLTIVATAIMGLSLNAGIANAATFTSASVTLSDPRPSATSGYTVKVSSVSNALIKCVQLVWSTTSTGEVNPTGFDGTAGTVTGGSSSLVNNSTWTLTRSDGTGASAGADNKWQYTDSTGVTPSTLTNATFVTAGLTNSNTGNTGFYLKVNTFSDQSCATARDNTTVQFINTAGSTLSLTVDGSLTFTVNGLTTSDVCSDGSTVSAVNTSATTIPFGTMVAATPKQACQRLNAATNSTNGFTIFVRYDTKPANALGDFITDASGSNNAPATFASVDAQGAYGYSTNDTTLSGSAGTGAGQANRFTNGTLYAAGTTSNAEVAFEAAGVTSTDYVVTHKVVTTSTTKPGTYSNTIIYTCTPVY
jgi:hypothetical protein